MPRSTAFGASSIAFISDITGPWACDVTTIFFPDPFGGAAVCRGQANGEFVEPPRSARLTLASLGRSGQRRLAAKLPDGSLVGLKLGHAARQNGRMDSDQRTAEQAIQLSAAFLGHVNDLLRLKLRTEDLRFPDADPLHEAVRAAYDAVWRLRQQIHGRSIQRGCRDHGAEELVALPGMQRARIATEHVLHRFGR